MDTKFIKLSIEEGKAFIEKNKDKLIHNMFMDYDDYYNEKALHNRAESAYDHWEDKIVIRRSWYNDYYDLNVKYSSWR